MCYSVWVCERRDKVSTIRLIVSRHSTRGRAVVRRAREESPRESTPSPPRPRHPAPGRGPAARGAARSALRGAAAPGPVRTRGATHSHSEVTHSGHSHTHARTHLPSPLSSYHTSVFSLNSTGRVTSKIHRKDRVGIRRPLTFRRCSGLTPQAQSRWSKVEGTSLTQSGSAPSSAAPPAPSTSMPASG